MRTTKELLQLILEEGNKSFTKGNSHSMYSDGYCGLCGFAFDLFNSYYMMNKDEWNIIDSYIKDNKPPKNSPHYWRKQENSDGFYWKPGKWAPRKSWLEDQIKSL